jgi:dihydrodipicolinate synthase/N-acetylneuraminate lyase
VKAALALMGLLETDTVRAPLLALDVGARERLGAVLGAAGLVEADGGRIATPEREAVA